MILFYNTPAEHLAKKINVRKGKFMIKRFSDGEIYARINEKVRGKQVWVVASTNSPGDNLLELAFLLDALKREGARINLLVTYFGYARQDRRIAGESLSAEVVCGLLESAEKTIVLHAHSRRLEKFLDYDDILPLELYYPIIKRYEVIIAPDRGILGAARTISRETGIPLALMKKIRPAHEKAEIVKLEGSVKNKKVIIIDDLISTGGTIISASRALKKHGAKEVSVLATHGIFSADAIKKISQSRIKKIYVTNSLAQKSAKGKIKIIDLSKFIEGIIRGRARYLYAPYSPRA